MPEDRNKGQFVQAGSLVIFHTSVVEGSMEGTLAMDTAYLQADYPDLFAHLGTTYNDGAKGDDNATQFRTPQEPDWATDADWVMRIRF